MRSAWLLLATVSLLGSMATRAHAVNISNCGSLGGDQFVTALNNNSESIINFTSTSCIINFSLSDAQESSSTFGKTLGVVNRPLTITGTDVTLSGGGNFHAIVAENAGTLTVQGVSFEGFGQGGCCGALTQEGGAIAAMNTNVVLEQTQFNNVNADSAVFVQGTVTVNNSSFFNNNNVAIVASGATGLISNSTFYSNSNALQLNGTITVKHVTFAGGGSCAITGSGFSVYNSLFTTSSNCCNPPVAAIGNAESSFASSRCSAGPGVSGSLNTFSPETTGLGGTQIVRPNSQGALNTGVAPHCLPTDQRGQPRTRLANGICDAGAVEAQPQSVALVSGFVSSTLVGTMFPGPLKAQIVDNNGFSLAGVSVQVTVPSTGASATPTTQTLPTVGMGPDPTMIFAPFPLTANNTGGTYNAIVKNLGPPNNQVSVLLTNVQPTVSLSVAPATPSSVVIGEPFMVSATANKNPSNAPTPTGTLTFKIGADVLCTTTLPITSCTATYPTAGTYNIVVEYSGDGLYPANSAQRNNGVTITKATTVTTLGGAASNRIGETNDAPVTVTASGTTAIPTGSIECRIASTLIATVPLVDGAATCSFPATTLGATTISATYVPDVPKFNGSSASHGWTVLKQALTLAIVEHTPDPSPQNTVVTVTVKATPNFGTTIPTGMVSVTDGTNTYMATLDGSGVGTCSMLFSSEGLKTLTASYPGDANFDPATSMGVVHTVGQADTSIELAAQSPSPAYVGDTVTLTARVTRSSGLTAPTGSVTIADGVHTCTETLGASLEVSCTFMYTEALSGTLTLSYTGDSNYKASTANITPFNILAVNAVRIASDLNPAPFGAPVTFTIRVITNVLTPTGFVLVTSPGRAIEKLPLVDGIATLTRTDLAFGTTTLDAVYSLDGAAATPVTGSFTQTVVRASTTVALATAKSPIVVGETATLTATIAVLAPGAGMPTGMVRFSAGATSLGDVALTDGVAVLTTRELDAGSLAITAEYLGDQNFAGSSAGLPGGGTQVVAPSLSSGCAAGGVDGSASSLLFAAAWLISRCRRRRPAPRQP